MHVQFALSQYVFSVGGLAGTQCPGGSLEICAYHSISRYAFPWRRCGQIFLHTGLEEWPAGNPSVF